MKANEEIISGSLSFVFFVSFNFLLPRTKNSSVTLKHTSIEKERKMNYEKNRKTFFKCRDYRSMTGSDSSRTNSVTVSLCSNKDEKIASGHFSASMIQLLSNK